MAQRSSWRGGTGVTSDDPLLRSKSTANLDPCSTILHRNQASFASYSTQSTQNPPSPRFHLQKKSFTTLQPDISRGRGYQSDLISASLIPSQKASDGVARSPPRLLARRSSKIQETLPFLAAEGECRRLEDMKETSNGLKRVPEAVNAWRPSPDAVASPPPESCRPTAGMSRFVPHPVSGRFQGRSSAYVVKQGPLREWTVLRDGRSKLEFAEAPSEEGAWPARTSPPVTGESPRRSTPESGKTHVTSPYFLQPPTNPQLIQNRSTPNFQIRSLHPTNLKCPRALPVWEVEDEEEPLTEGAFQRGKSVKSKCEKAPGSPCVESKKEGKPAIASAQQVRHQSLPSRSYAEVVRSGWSKPRQPQSSTHPSSAYSSATNRQRRVLFSNSPRIAIFYKGSPPAEFQVLGRPNHLVTDQRLSPNNNNMLRSCLKLSVGSDQKTRACQELYGLRGESNQHPRQLVRKFWWREDKRSIRYSHPTPNWCNLSFFKEKTRGRCFNCLARDHRVAQCRDPTRCWFCGGSGHISSSCKIRAASRRHRKSCGKDRCAPNERRRWSGYSVSPCSRQDDINSPRFCPRVVNNSGYTSIGLDDHGSMRHVETRDVNYRGLYSRSWYPDELCAHEPCWLPRVEDAKDRDRRRSHTRGVFGRASRGRFSRKGRYAERNLSLPPERCGVDSHEKRAMHLLGKSKRSRASNYFSGALESCTSSPFTSAPHDTAEPHEEDLQQLVPGAFFVSDAIEIVPQEIYEIRDHHQQSYHWSISNHEGYVMQDLGMMAPWQSDAIVVPLTTTKHIGHAELPATTQQYRPELANMADQSGQNQASQEGGGHAIDNLVDTQEVVDAILVKNKISQEEADGLTLRSNNCARALSTFPQIEPLAFIEHTSSQHEDAQVTQPEDDHSAGEKSEFYKVLKLFKKTTTKSVSNFISQTPSSKAYICTKAVKHQSPNQRNSPRLKTKIRRVKTMVRMAHKLGKWSVIYDKRSHKKSKKATRCVRL